MGIAKRILVVKRDVIKGLTDLSQPNDTGIPGDTVQLVNEIETVFVDETFKELFNAGFSSITLRMPIVEVVTAIYYDQPQNHIPINSDTPYKDVRYVVNGIQDDSRAHSLHWSSVIDSITNDIKPHITKVYEFVKRKMKSFEIFFTEVEYDEQQRAFADIENKLNGMLNGLTAKHKDAIDKLKKLAERVPPIDFLKQMEEEIKKIDWYDEINGYLSELFLVNFNV